MPQNKPGCNGTGRLAAAQRTLSAVSTGASLTADGLALAGLTPITAELEVPAAAAKGLSIIAQVRLAGLNVYDAVHNGNVAPLVSQGAGLGLGLFLGKLLPAAATSPLSSAQEEAGKIAGSNAGQQFGNAAACVGP